MKILFSLNYFDVSVSFLPNRNSSLYLHLPNQNISIHEEDPAQNLRQEFELCFLLFGSISLGRYFMYVQCDKLQETGVFLKTVDTVGNCQR